MNTIAKKEKRANNYQPQTLFNGGFLAGLLGLCGLCFRLISLKPSFEILFSLVITITGFLLALIAGAMLAKPESSRIDKPARDRQSGQGLVEFSLLFPFLILLLAGIADLGRGYQAQTLITNAASEGAQYATFNPSVASGIRTRVTNALAGSGITIAAPTSCPDICIIYPNGNSSGQPVQVQVKYKLTTILGSILGFNSIMIQGANQAIIY